MIILKAYRLILPTKVEDHLHHGKDKDSVIDAMYLGVPKTALRINDFLEWLTEFRKDKLLFSSLWFILSMGYRKKSEKENVHRKEFRKKGISFMLSFSAGIKWTELYSLSMDVRQYLQSISDKVNTSTPWIQEFYWQSVIKSWTIHVSNFSYSVCIHSHANIRLQMNKNTNPRAHCREPECNKRLTF